MSRGSKSKPESAQSSLLSLQENEKLEEMLGRRCADCQVRLNFAAQQEAETFRNADVERTNERHKRQASPGSPGSFHMANYLDTDLLKLLSQAGISKDEMKDEKTSQLIFNVIEQSGGMEAVKREMNRGAARPPPPSPGRQEPPSPVPGSSHFPLNPPPPPGCQVGLYAVLENINQRHSRRKRKQRPLPPSERGSLPPLPPEKVDIQNPGIQSSRYRSMPSPDASSILSHKGKKDKNKKAGAKADIGAFKHVPHTGWDPDNLDPDLLKLLSQAGITKDEMKDEKTSQLIFNVIEQSGGMEAVKREMNRGAARPPPGKQGPLSPVPGSSHSAPDPPPP